MWHYGESKWRCDNAAAVAIVNSGKSKDDRAMHLIRSLFFFLALYNVFVVAENFRGVDNCAADALSQNDASSFLLQVPSACLVPSIVHHELLLALVLNQPDWTSASWTSWLTIFCKRFSSFDSDYVPERSDQIPTFLCSGTICSSTSVSDSFYAILCPT